MKKCLCIKSWKKICKKKFPNKSLLDDIFEPGNVYEYKYTRSSKQFSVYIDGSQNRNCVKWSVKNFNKVFRDVVDHRDEQIDKILC